jgi:hypothetical protein
MNGRHKLYYRTLLDSSRSNKKKSYKNVKNHIGKTAFGEVVAISQETQSALAKDLKLDEEIWRNKYSYFTLQIYLNFCRSSPLAVCQEL